MVFSFFVRLFLCRNAGVLFVRFLDKFCIPFTQCDYLIFIFFCSLRGNVDEFRFSLCLNFESP